MFFYLSHVIKTRKMAIANRTYVSFCNQLRLIPSGLGWVPHSQLRHIYLTVIWPVLEYASPVWHHLITKKQSDQIEAIQKRAIRIIYRCAQDMPYASAIFLPDLPTITMSDRRDQLARKYFKSTIHPTSSLHKLLPPPWEHPSITRLRVPSKFPHIPTRTKNTNHSSHMLSPTIRLHNCFFQCIYCFLCLCFSVYFVQFCSASGYYFQ